MYNYTKKIKPYVEAELKLYSLNSKEGHHAIAFKHLENAHILGQESIFSHVKVHCLMILWAYRQKNIHELIGQIIRIAGAAMATAAIKTGISSVPRGNTGGANVSPFQAMPISSELEKIIQEAKNV